MLSIFITNDAFFYKKKICISNHSYYAYIIFVHMYMGGWGGVHSRYWRRVMGQCIHEGSKIVYPWVHSKPYGLRQVWFSYEVHSKSPPSKWEL